MAKYVDLDLSNKNSFKDQVMKTFAYILTLLMILFVGCGSGGGSVDSSKSMDTINKSDSPKENRDELNSNLKQRVATLEAQDNSIGDTTNLMLEREKVEVVLLGEEYKHDQLFQLDENKEVINKAPFYYEGEVDTSKVGEYIQSYYIIENGKKRGFKKYILVVQNTPPRLELIGDSYMRVQLGESVVIPFVKAYDSEEFDTISNNIKVDGYVNLYKSGKYTIKYSVKDRGGLSSEVTRVVEVYNRDDMKINEIEDENKTIELLSFLKTAQDHYVRSYREKSYLSKNFRKSLLDGSEVGDFDIVLATPDDRPKSFILAKRDKNSDETMYNTLIKKRVNVGDYLTTNCKLLKHYKTLTIASKDYNDVIKIECRGRAEGYYQKDYGLIAQNIFLPLTGSNRVIVSDDLVGREMMDVDPLYKEFHLSGRGVKVGVVDGGFVNKDHVELSNRVIWEKRSDENLSLSIHASHVAGIIGNIGNNGDALGVATASKIFSYSLLQYDYDVIEILNDLLKKDIYLSNHSYGPDTNKSYAYLSQNIDHFVYQNPAQIIVNSAGNSRKDDDYWIIKDLSSAKNVITVGAIQKDMNIADFSSVGPVDNGRLKPDIVAYGKGVKSIDEKSGYIWMSGTSMAAPHITGLLALLEEEYQRINNHRLRSDLAKALLINSATDLGREGPDYEYGYGLPDAYKAVQAIDSMKRVDSRVILDSVKEGEERVYTIRLDKDKDLKLTLAWIDPSDEYKYTSDDLTENINTDLDIKLIASDGTIYYPWSLDSDDPTLLATATHKNSVDNVEEIKAHLKRGEYKVVISNSLMNIGVKQDFALVGNVPLEGEAMSADLMKKIEFEDFLMGIL
jgi:subtilisin family serine protease